MTIRSAVEADLGRTMTPRAFAFAFAYLTVPSVSAAVLLRTSEALLAQGHLRMSRLVRSRLANKHGVHIAEGADLGAVRMPHPAAIVIGPSVVIGDGTLIYQGVTIGAVNPRCGDYDCPTLGTNVTVYANAVIVGGIKIGDGATIGGGAFVAHDVVANHSSG